MSEQTSLTGDSVNIYVENKTTLKGAVIASTSNDITLNTGSFEYIHIKDKDISYNAGAGVNLGSNSTGKPEEKNNTWSVNASYGFSQKRQTNFATIGEGTIIVREGNTDLSGLNRDVTKSQYQTVDIGLTGAFTLDSSTVALVTDPGKQITDAIDSLERGYNDAKKTTEEIYEKFVFLYERTSNLIAGDGFQTDSEVKYDKIQKIINNSPMFIDDNGIMIIRNSDGTTDSYSSNQQRLENEAMSNAKMILVGDNENNALAYKVKELLENHAVVCVQTETVLIDNDYFKITKLDGVQLRGDGEGKATFTLNTQQVEYITSTGNAQYKFEASTSGQVTATLGNSVPGLNQFGISKEGLLVGLELSEPINAKGANVFTNSTVVVKPGGIAAIGAVLILSNPELGIPAGAKIIYDATK